MQDGERFTLSPAPGEDGAVPESGVVGSLAVYNVAQEVASRRALNVAATYSAGMEYGGATSPPVYAHRYITGRGGGSLNWDCLVAK